MRRAVFSSILMVSMAASSASMAQESSNQVNAKTDWSVFTEPAGSDNPTECWVVSKPTKVVNTRNGERVDARRSDILLFVSFVPGQGVAGEVSFTGGYAFKKDHPIVMQIGSSRYELTPEGEWAWPASSDADNKIRESMKRGATAVITASSARPTLTEDTFSLSGFTAALEDAAKRCGS